jgi:uncharacterized protein (TIGR02117 family)
MKQDERIHLITILLVFVAACAMSPPGAPPASAEQTRTVYVAAHGWHTGLIVRSRDVPRDAWPARVDFPEAEYLELGWGEREYYMREDAGVWLGLRALLWSTSSAIHAAGFRGPVAGEFPRSEIVELRVAQAGFQRLVSFVGASHERDAAGRTIVLAPGQRPGSLFYASHRRFHLFETCNTWVARALQEAGVPVEPRSATTAEGLMRQLRPLALP